MFVTYQGDLLGRFDPNYIKNISYINNINTLYSLVPLGSLLTEQPMYGANERAIDGDPQTEVRYIRITDIDDHGKLQNEDWKTAKRVDEKYALDENDILFARSGATAGKTFIYKSEYGKAIFAGYTIRFRFDRTKVNPLFVFYYTLLSRYRRWVRIIQRPSGQPNINSREFKSFELPLAPLDIQNHIVEIMQSAYAQKRLKDQQANAILDSIGDYVLGELEVEKPVVEENKCFVVYANETSGRRGDPHFHQPQYRSFYNILEVSKYQVVMLANLIQLIYRYPSCYGFSCYDSASDTRVPFLQGEDIDVNEISHEKLIFVEKEISAQYPKTILKEGDLIFSVRGTIGKIALVTHEFENSNISPNLIRLSLDEGVNPQYVEIVLKSKIGQYQINRLTSGGVQPTITKQDIFSIEMPLPPLDIQERIADEVVKRQSEAAKLRQEVDAIVERAKREVEQILLEKES